MCVFGDISMVIPSYCDSLFVNNLVDNVAIQTLLPKEVIIVDDGSDKKGRLSSDLSFYNSLRNINIEIIIVFQNHKGAAAARNSGIRISRNPYIFFCDADIVLEQHCLQKLYNAIVINAADLSYCKFDHGNGTKEIGKHHHPILLAKNNFIGGIALVRKTALPQKGWDESLLRYQDWELWQRMLIRDQRKAIFTNEVLFHASTRPGGISSGRSISRAEAKRRVIEKMLKWDIGDKRG